MSDDDRAGLEPAAARSALAGEQFVFHVQGHHLEYQLMPKDRNKPFFGSVFPQVNCGKDDPHACFHGRSSWRTSSSAATRT